MPQTGHARCVQAMLWGVALSIAAPALAAWPAQPIEVVSGVAAEVVVESATLRTVAT